ncbi:MAG: DUF389 domain-containing protein [Acidobacteria bacterium]|nr:DUF389 domain-containing protein [Acidobacteriota bacterium]
MAKETNKSVGSFRFFIRIYRFWRRFRDRFAASINVSYGRKVELYTQLASSATVRDVVYWLQILFSAGIATLGLVLNSSAVIIGAMLISPLMAPILSLGLALSTGDLILGIRAFVNLFLSTLLGVVFAFLLVALLPFKDITSEIMVRTEPNTLDLVIALFSGAIGSIATCKEVKGVVTSIPGVAIAVALMPPLCVIGFGLGYAVSLGDWRGIEIASGGGLLYLTNLVAITFTAMLVFVLLRIDTVKVRDAVRIWRDEDSESDWWLRQIGKIPALKKAREVRSFSLRLLMILLPLLIIFFPLSSSFSKLRTEITKKQAENSVSQTVRRIWKQYEGDSEGNIRSYLDELRITDSDDTLKIYLRVFDNRPYTPAERKQYINLVAKELKREPETISLQLVEIPTSEREASSPVVETTPTPETVAQRQENYLRMISTSLADFTLPQPAVMIDYNVTSRSNGTAYIEMFYLSSRNIDDDGQSALQEIVRTRLNLPTISLILTRVSSEPRVLSFEGATAEIVDKEGALDRVADKLRQHPNLRLRVTLKKEKPDETIVEERKRSVLRFLANNSGVSSDKVVFVEAEDNIEDTFQVFLKN